MDGALMASLDGCNTVDMTQHASPPPPFLDKAKIGQVVLVLQGGGALGAYQVGVFQALAEAGIEPDWVIGTSIGAINAGIIAGNRPENRLDRINQFWNDVHHDAFTRMAGALPVFGSQFANAMTVAMGVPGFFQPNPLAMMGSNWPMRPESTGYYSTAPLEKTLNEVIDPEVLASCSTRLTVGAAHVQTGEMRYFDSNDQPLTIKHIMASGALPPAFPAVRIDGELYWDGGILSNTPAEAVFDARPRRSGLVFLVHIWNPTGPEPDTLQRVMSRQKDLQYASRAKAQIARQGQLHKLRHVVKQLSALLPEDVRARPEVAELAAYGCTTQMHVVRLLAPPIDGEDHTKDIDFSCSGVKARREAGYADTMSMIERSPWREPTDPIEGVVEHH
jgi:NTE family protein